MNGACQIPVDGGVGSAGTTVLPGTVPIGSPCTAHSQCVDGAYCQGSFCASVGFCQARDNCATCGPSGTAGCRVCGCDGVNYPSIQAACAAGVRVAEANSCGSATVVEPRDSGIPAPVRIGCGTDAQCPSGQSCCAITGHCYDPADCPGCCTLPPPGTSFPCVRDSQCYAESEYCGGPGGCGAPGGCARRGVSQCGPELALVCGCDGRTYRNAGCAANAGVRLAHDGACACGAGSRCVAGQYCAGDGCDTPGTCIDIPATCDGEIAPVCGCDGRSYTNARCASVGGTRVATTGQCH